MSRAFSYIAMICGFISSILFAILAALYRAGNTHLYLCIAVTCMAFIFVRFNLVALRNDKTDRLFVVNNGAVLVKNLYVRIFIAAILAIQYFCFIFMIKTTPKQEILSVSQFQKKQREKIKT